MTGHRDDDRKPQLIEMNLAELIPTEWHDQQVWVSCYRAYRLRKDELVATEHFELLDVRGQLFWGGAPLFKSALRIEPQPDGGVVVHSEPEGIRHTPEGPYLMLMTRTDYPRAEEDTRSQIRSVLALLRLTLGPNIAVEPLSDLVFTASTSNVTALESFRPPSASPPQYLDPGRRGSISDLHKSINGLPREERNRVELSLDWFFRASEAFGVDGFLMYWFALETLAMPGNKSLAAVVDKLGEIYKLDKSTVQARFRLGRLYGLRGNIVHSGLRPPIQTRVLDFVGAVYWDLLLHTLKLDARHAAGRILDAHHIDDWFPNGSAKPT